MRLFILLKYVFCRRRRRRIAENIDVYELAEYLEANQQREILSVESLKSEEIEVKPKMQKNVNYVDLGKGVLLPIKPDKKMAKAKSSHLYDTDSDDEEILFSREMLKRLRRKEQQMNGFNDATDNTPADNSSERLSQKSSSSSSKNQSSLSPPLSDRTTKSILRRIAGHGDAEEEEEKRKSGKEYYFGKRMTKFNNLVRVLEQKKEESIWAERYSEAAGIDKSIKELRAREAGLQQLLIEREDALKFDNLIEAQRAKDRFEKNMSDAIYLPTIRGYLDQQELVRLGL